MYMVIPKINSTYMYKDYFDFNNLTEQTNFNSHIVTRLYMIPVTRL